MLIKPVKKEIQSRLHSFYTDSLDAINNLSIKTLLFLEHT